MKRRPHTLILLFCVSVIFFLGCRAAEDVLPPPPAEPRFPELVPVGGLPDGFDWSLTDGPDFYVWYASNEEESAGGGIYIGHHPTRLLEERARTITGEMVSVPIEWTVHDEPADDGPDFLREGVIRYRYARDVDEVYLHAWFYAETEETIVALLKSIESLRFDWKRHDELKEQSEPARADNAD